MKELFLKSTIKPFALLTIIPNVAIAPQVNLESVVWILVAFFVFDLGTGLAASWFEWRKTVKKGNFFFGNKDGFSSDKFKKCFFKGIIYGGFPLVVHHFQKTFLIKPITISSVTDSQFDITIVCLLVFCANEFFSIFWENLPKCGLNIPKGIKNIIFGVKEIVTETKIEEQ